MSICRFFDALLAGIVKMWYRLFYPVKVMGDEGDVMSRQSGAKIYVCNHTSMHDGLVMSLLLRRARARAVIAKDMIKNCLFASVTRAAGGIEIERYGMDTAWLRNSLAALRRGESIIIFPEGKISRSGDIAKFKGGFMLLALLSGAEVVLLFHSRGYGFCRSMRLFAKNIGRYEIDRSVSAQYLDMLAHGVREEMCKMQTAADGAVSARRIAQNP